MTIIHCKQCPAIMTWFEVKREYGRLMKSGYTKEKTKELLPLCHKCVTLTLNPPKSKMVQL